MNHKSDIVVHQTMQKINPSSLKQHKIKESSPVPFQEKQYLYLLSFKRFMNSKNASYVLNAGINNSKEVTD